MSDYPLRETEKLAACDVSPRRMTLRARLEEAKRQLNERLAEIQGALDMIDKHPEFEAFHNAIGKAGY